MKFEAQFNDSTQLMEALDILPRDDSPLGRVRQAIYEYVVEAVMTHVALEKRATLEDWERNVRQQLVKAEHLEDDGNSEPHGYDEKEET